MFQLLLLVCLTGTSFGANIPGRGEIEGFIMGGRDTDISEIPYQVALLMGSRFICGGSIIAPTMIVTAAHCIKDLSPRGITIRAGSSLPGHDGVLINSETYWLHPNYVARTYDYDVAVIKLREPLKYSNTIKPAELATSRPSDGSLVTISGWGALWSFGPMATVLQSVKVPIVDTTTCATFFGNFMKITPRMVCAGVEGKDSCQGDSGGPLSANGKLAGIVSFGMGCGGKEPGVYTDVSNPEINSFIQKYAKM